MACTVSELIATLQTLQNQYGPDIPVTVFGYAAGHGIFGVSGAVYVPQSTTGQEVMARIEIEWTDTECYWS